MIADNRDSPANEGCLTKYSVNMDNCILTDFSHVIANGLSSCLMDDEITTMAWFEEISVLKVPLTFIFCVWYSSCTLSDHISLLFSLSLQGTDQANLCYPSLNLTPQHLPP